MGLHSTLHLGYNTTVYKIPNPYHPHMQLPIPAAALSSGSPALPLFLMSQALGDAAASAQPGLWLLPPQRGSGGSSSGSNAALMVSWMGSVQIVDISGAIAQSVVRVTQRDEAH